jgi:hypothetical protein
LPLFLTGRRAKTRYKRRSTSLPIYGSERKNWSLVSILWVRKIIGPGSTLSSELAEIQTERMTRDPMMCCGVKQPPDHQDSTLGARLPSTMSVLRAPLHLHITGERHPAERAGIAHPGSQGGPHPARSFETNYIPSPRSLPSGTLRNGALRNTAGRKLIREHSQ